MLDCFQKTNAFEIVSQVTSRLLVTGVATRAWRAGVVGVSPMAWPREPRVWPEVPTPPLLAGRWRLSHQPAPHSCRPRCSVGGGGGERGGSAVWSPCLFCPARHCRSPAGTSIYSRAQNVCVLILRNNNLTLMDRITQVFGDCYLAEDLVTQKIHRP